MATPRTRPLRTAAAILTLALVATACNGDDDAQDDTSPSPTEAATTESSEPTETTPEASGDPIAIMTILEMEGPGANPEIVDGATAAVDGINADGGIDGRPLELIVCDTGSDPNQAAACGQQAVDDGVVAVVGSLSALSSQFMPILTENSIPVIGIVPAGQDEYTSPMSFPLTGGVITAGAGLADALARQGATTVSLARIDLPQAAALAQFAGAGLAQHGQQVNHDVAVPAGAPDMASYVAAALDGGTDGILVGLFGQDATNFITELENTAPDTHVAATATDLAGVIEALGDGAAGLITSASFASPDSGTPAMQEYLDDMAAGGYENRGFTLNAYASVKILVIALGASADVSGPSIAEALGGMDSVTTGLLPPLNFTQGGVAGLPRIFNACQRYLEVVDGESQPFTDGFVDPFTGEACPEP